MRQKPKSRIKIALLYAGLTIVGAGVFASNISNSGIVRTQTNGFAQEEGFGRGNGFESVQTTRRPEPSPWDDGVDAMPMGEFASDDELVTDPRGFNPNPGSDGRPREQAPSSEIPYLSEQDRGDNDDPSGGWGID